LAAPWDEVPGTFDEHILVRELVDVFAGTGAFAELFTILRRTRPQI
jgi:hypothetical protein